MTEEKCPYVICSVNGFDRVPDTKVLLKAEDYKLFMKYLEQAAAKNPETEIVLDPDDCGECYGELAEFLKYNISVKPIKAETYEDIRDMYGKDRFGFNYVLDAVLDAVFNVIEPTLKPDEVEWFALRSESVDWILKDRETKKKQAAKIDMTAVRFVAANLCLCSSEVGKLASERVVDTRELKEQIAKIAGFAKKLENLMVKL